MYERFAHEYASHAEDSAYNALYDRPAMLGLAGDVRGRAVFDAACGPGFYARELLERGARVTGCDVSPTFSTWPARAARGSPTCASTTLPSR